MKIATRTTFFRNDFWNARKYLLFNRRLQEKKTSRRRERNTHKMCDRSVEFVNVFTITSLHVSMNVLLVGPAAHFVITCASSFSSPAKRQKKKIEIEKYKWIERIYNRSLCLHALIWNDIGKCRISENINEINAKILRHALSVGVVDRKASRQHTRNEWSEIMICEFKHIHLFMFNINLFMNFSTRLLVQI